MMVEGYGEFMAIYYWLNLFGSERVWEFSVEVG